MKIAMFGIRLHLQELFRMILLFIVVNATWYLFQLPTISSQWPPPRSGSPFPRAYHKRHLHPPTGAPSLSPTRPERDHSAALQSRSRHLVMSPGKCSCKGRKEGVVAGGGARGEGHGVGRGVAWRGGLCGDKRPGRAWRGRVGYALVAALLGISCFSPLWEIGCVFRVTGATLPQPIAPAPCIWSGVGGRDAIT